MFGLGATALDLIMRMRSCIKTKCVRCLGPIVKGDLVVTEPGGRVTDVMHRSCLFISKADAKAARDRRRFQERRGKKKRAANRRQATLFATGPTRGKKQKTRGAV
jgi:hypothetical protein